MMGVCVMGVGCNQSLAYAGNVLNVQTMTYVPCVTKEININYDIASIESVNPMRKGTYVMKFVFFH